MMKISSPIQTEDPAAPIGEAINQRATRLNGWNGRAMKRLTMSDEQDNSTMEDIFGKVISSYSRRQAIQDGVLVDLMQPETVCAVREAGFKWPVAMTATAFAATISEPGEPLPEGQDIDGRLWDVLWMLSLAVKRMHSSGDRLTFSVKVWDGHRHNTVKLWSLCGPGDDAAPVITIMLEGED